MSFTDIILPLAQAATMPLWVLMVVAPNWHITKKITTPWASVIPLAVAVGYYMTALPALLKVIIGSSTAPFADYDGLVEFFDVPAIAIGSWLVVVALDLFGATWMFRHLHRLQAKTWVISVMSTWVFLFPQFALLVFIAVIKPLYERRLKAAAGTDERVPATV
ncbi:hypothetical protein BBK82_44680 [Lentzea guizhouensis]|uniref:DUF4281 domain-containing protein n=1 Tax=Lentzea guizhouensis TaxID=1586287 RepID=A0A1B2HWA6_9PSEU|nr:abscisic acid-deficient protein Aba4 family protein [Lentzea guizhouensis]ANZ41983.1 hypothetical protein BBK82_44680 [Lentzea guizhouensis]